MTLSLLDLGLASMDGRDARSRESGRCRFALELLQGRRETISAELPPQS